MSRNDWFALLLLGNNIGATVPQGYAFYLSNDPSSSKSLKQWLAFKNDQGETPNRDQLALMLAYVQYLSENEGWELPEGIDMNYLWSLVE